MSRLANEILISDPSTFEAEGRIVMEKLARDPQYRAHALQSALDLSPEAAAVLVQLADLIDRQNGGEAAINLLRHVVRNATSVHYLVMGDMAAGIYPDDYSRGRVGLNSILADTTSPWLDYYRALRNAHDAEATATADDNPF